MEDREPAGGRRPARTTRRRPGAQGSTSGRARPPCIQGGPKRLGRRLRRGTRCGEGRSAGAVVPGLQVGDAVSKGVLDGGHGIPAFWFGKNGAFGLYGAGPDFGMDANQLMGWVEYGGGKELFVEIQKAAQLNIVSYLGGP